ncbi:MAG TPA: PilZ domain-containing protein [Devosiaceae bacterium]|jgi:hypothetical protein|nr:PilZ domain-containing protein [Devosiaceae bacterium]
MATNSEHRGVPRHRTLKGARIVFNGGRSTIDCTVRNLSVAGAKLDVASVVGVPDSFDLAMGDELRPCRIIWRTSGQMGVEFEDAEGQAR